MKFGSVPVDQASGCLLAHSAKVGGKRLKKGHLLDESDVAAFRDAGRDHVTVARLEAGDMSEDEAAASIAAALAGGAIRAEKAFTGRANLFAAANGLFLAAKDRIDRANGIDPGITIATLANDSDVRDGRMVATVKIIPFAVAAEMVEQVIAALTGSSGALSLHPYRPRKFGMISTRLPVLKESVIDKTVGVFEKRLEASGSRLVGEMRVDHDVDALAAAIKTMAAAGHSGLVIFGASAIADRDDVIPTAIERAGGTVTWFGMPVDPGNLLLLGRLGDIDIIGAPGCARSPSENGFDWVLNRLLAGIDVTPEWIKSLGVGGLLMEIHSRPQPREG